MHGEKKFRQKIGKRNLGYTKIGRMNKRTDEIKC